MANLNSGYVEQVIKMTELKIADETTTESTGKRNNYLGRLKSQKVEFKS